MKTNRIGCTTLMTLLATLVVAFMMTSTAAAVEIPTARMSANGVCMSAGKVTGFSFDGLFWTTEEYTQMSGIERMSNTSVVSVNDQEEAVLDTGINRVFDLDLSSDELKELSSEINLVIADSEVDPSDSPSCDEIEAARLGMAEAMTVDARTGEKTILLDGYTFKIAKETNMDSVLGQLQRWSKDESPYKDQFFSESWIYKTVKVADGAQAVIVDAFNKVIAFSVNESIDELDPYEILAMQRLAVVKDARTAAEIG